ncbi:hypothetical protein [Aquicoccus sp.]|uniref:hypothetical protein n=1 Tax=Aquicoccus sp. TaxID=2055851 RepID=UPI003568FC81
MKIRIPSLAAISLLMTPALAVGQGIGEADANGDGFLTMQEVQAVNPEITIEDFNSMDSNADGVLDEAEVQAAQDMGLMEAPSTD